MEKTSSPADMLRNIEPSEDFFVRAIGEASPVVTPCEILYHREGFKTRNITVFLGKGKFRLDLQGASLPDTEPHIFQTLFLVSGGDQDTSYIAATIYPNGVILVGGKLTAAAKLRSWPAMWLQLQCMKILSPSMVVRGEPADDVLRAWHRRGLATIV